MLISLVPKHILPILPESLPVFEHSSFDLKPFDERTIAFANDLSRRILSNRRYNRLAAMVALAYWLRRANMQRLVAENLYLTQQPRIALAPVGVVFHVCPSNVDTMFLYSLMVSLLMGNKNVLRVSSKLDHPFIDFLFQSLNDMLDTEGGQIFKNYINILSYPHDRDINTFLSQRADARLIWGGDQTAHLFKSLPANPRGRDIVFADRLSFSIINVAAFLAEPIDNQREIARLFYNDAYTFDQKGCSSPQTIFLLNTVHQTPSGGEEGQKQTFEKQFYKLLAEQADAAYSNDNYSLASLKFNQLVGDVLADRVVDFKNDSATLYFVETETARLDHTCGGGYFYTYPLSHLEDLRPYLNQKIQTISYFGLTDAEKWALADMTAGIGVDRIVPIGQALAFDYIWDGYNLVEALSVKKAVI
jgi:hypothetical protein